MRRHGRSLNSPSRFPCSGPRSWQCPRPMLTLAGEIKAPQTAVPEESPMLHEASVRSAG